MRAPPSELPITVEGVSVRSGGVIILERISLVLAPGAPTVLIGPNGSGKTSLIRLAMGLIPPTTGRIAWGGYGATEGRRRAIVFQRPVMLRRSVAGNIAFALRSGAIASPAPRDRIAALLDLVGLAALGPRPARRLSGGEQLRVALARALARDRKSSSLTSRPPISIRPPPKRLKTSLRKLPPPGLRSCSLLTISARPAVSPAM